MAKQEPKIESINFSFRERLNETLSGRHHNYCYQCGACVSYCPVVNYAPEFNPRMILLMAMFGLEDRLISADSVIWKCTNCYTCYERCPQDVRPVEVITALKNICVERGLAPALIEEYSKGILTTGMSAPLSSAIESRREKFGLPEFKMGGYSEMKKLLAGEDNSS
ncbi:MAG: 4Fe-4S dicluster domain-containing protein [Candidatus Neomarinimicrobiota bacterium]